MKDRKISIALSSLNIYELNSFIKFVQSPYFNVNQSIAQFAQVISEAIKYGNLPILKPQDFWKQVYNNEPYNNQKFLKLNSDLTKLLETFLAQKEFESSESLITNLKLEGAKKRNLENLYSGIISEAERLNKSEYNQSAYYYLTKYLIEKNLFRLKTENEKKNEKFEITSALNIKAITDNLDYFYIADKLRQYCTLLSWKKMYKIEIEMDNMDYIIQMANRPPFNSIPPISIYYKMFLTYQDEGNLTNYHELRQLTKTFMHIFPIDEQREIYSTILGYCINKINKNQSDFFRETFEVYKDGISENILLVDHSISVTTFRNIAIAALRVEEFSWAESFIHDYAKYVDEKYRVNAVEFSLARLEFYRKNYGKVLEHLYKVSYEDVWYNLNTKTLQIASYYELDEFDALESLLQSFKMYIRREKSLSTDRKTHYLHLIKFTSALMKINHRDQQKLMKLKSEIETTQGVVSKPWLIEKVDQLIKK
ncbi:MAG TPA: hypothetical protein PKD16_08245 [Saprospiraceae bacterium]|jgi:hypothetical protein|nr:hypothetical protein [Saprospiraceae bacterium]HMT70138.1 hypothetical protein [Saprospiraceae bacterium]